VRKVFISGGTGAIGSALVRRFAEDGYDIEFSYNRRWSQADELSREYGIRKHRLDFTQAWSPPDTTADILVNNAGVNLSGHDLSDTTDPEITQTLEVNLLAAIRLARYFTPLMVSNGFGRIININSLYGVFAPARRLSYAISKFALRAMTGSLAQELAPHGVTVNDICPGPVDSEMLRSMGAQAVADRRYPDLEHYLTDVGREVPIGRLIKASEVAAVAAFLATESAAACTGQAILVDGGLRN
jgi:NAD(P)-dependent dehydrogenase (short-subunit alcohol dehydrogenase family)